jgi:hypothetical protein
MFCRVAAFEVDGLGGGAQVAVPEAVKERHFEHHGGVGAVEVVGHGLSALGELGVGGHGGWLVLNLASAGGLVMAMVMAMSWL